jgi:hypothetical protein
MLNATDDERQAIVDYLVSQARDERVELVQKVYSERLHGITHDIWDVHTDKDRWWVITEPTNFYSQSQFPNMDLALTFHVGLCVRIPRSERRDVTDLPVEPLLGCWRAFQQAHDAIGVAQEVEDYQALGVRCRECLLSLVHSVQKAIAPPASAAELKHSDFIGWVEAIADTALAGPSQKARRQLLKTSAKAAWQFVNWLTHSRTAHFHDAEAALAATEQTLSLFTTATIRHIRGVPDCCPSCGSQRLAPERGMYSSEPDKLYERPVCTACGWAGEPVEVPVGPSATERSQSEGDCVIMTVPLRGARPPRPTGDDD